MAQSTRAQPTPAVKKEVWETEESEGDSKLDSNRGTSSPRVVAKNLSLGNAFEQMMKN